MFSEKQLLDADYFPINGNMGRDLLVREFISMMREYYEHTIYDLQREIAHLDQALEEVQRGEE